VRVVDAPDWIFCRKRASGCPFSNRERECLPRVRYFLLVPPRGEDRHRTGVLEPVAVAAQRDAEAVVGGRGNEHLSNLGLVVRVRERAGQQVLHLIAQLVKACLRLSEAGRSRGLSRQSIRQALRERAKERLQRCRGDCRRGVAAEPAVRPREEPGSAGPAGLPPGAVAIGLAANSNERSIKSAPF
jgi:hypothetical protein